MYSAFGDIILSVSRHRRVHNERGRQRFRSNAYAYQCRRRGGNFTLPPLHIVTNLERVKNCVSRRVKAMWDATVAALPLPRDSGLQV